MLGDLYRNLRALSPPRGPHRCRTVAPALAQSWARFRLCRTAEKG